MWGSIARILEAEAEASPSLAAKPRATNRATLGEINRFLAATGVGKLTAAIRANIVARQKTLRYGPLQAILNQGGNEAGPSVEDDSIAGGVGHDRAANEIAAGDATLHLAGGVGTVDRVQNYLELGNIVNPGEQRAEDAGRDGNSRARLEAGEEKRRHLVTPFGPHQMPVIC